MTPARGLLTGTILAMYRAALRAMPAAYRAQHAGEPVALLERVLDDTSRTRGSFAVSAVGLAAFADLAVRLPREHLSAIARHASDLAQDTHHALARLRRQPLFGIGTVLLLGVAIGLVTTVFAFTYATVFRPWQVADPMSVVILRARPAVPVPSDPNALAGRSLPLLGPISIAEVRHFQAETRTLSAVVAARRTNVQMSLANGPGVPGYVSAAFVTGNYFSVLGVRMLRGRGFVAEEDDYRNPVGAAVISEALWRTRFGADPDTVGRVVQIDGQPFTIVGITAGRFADVYSSNCDLWMPVTSQLRQTPTLAAAFIDPSVRTDFFTVIGRLRPGVTESVAESEVTAISRRFRAGPSLPTIVVDAMNTRPITRSGVRDEHQVLFLLLLALLLVLLLACANVGNLLLARALGRRRELAVRLSLGASRARVVRLLVTESAVLALLAGAIGLGIAWLAPDVAVRVIDDLERPGFYAPDLTVFGFALCLAVLTTMACGLPPALRGTRVGLGAIASERHGQPRRTARLRRALLAVQVALATVLLIGAGLSTRAIDHAVTLDLGFAVRESQMIEIEWPRGTDRARRQVASNAIRAALAAQPSLPVALSEQPPIEDSAYSMNIREGAGDRFVLARRVSPNYFSVLGIRLVAGRTLADRPAREIVVNKAAARRLWPDQDPIGKNVVEPGANGASTSTVYQVVGVVEDVPVRSVRRIEPVIYQSLSQSFLMIARDRGPATPQVIRDIVASVDSSLTLRVRPAAESVRDSLFVAIVASRVARAIGMGSLLLATFGAFGAFAFAVEERRREIGLRLALGARAGQILQLVFRTTRWALVVGLASGLVIAAAAATTFRSLLYGLSPFDPLAYAAIAAILAAAAALATWIPARRALRVDPMVVLRQE